MDADEEDFVEGTAYHEAGHAIVVWKNGARIIEIVIDSKNFEGYCKHDFESKMSFPLDPESMEPSQWLCAEKKAQILWAGAVAQKRFDSTTVIYKMDPDMEELNSLVTKLFPLLPTEGQRWLQARESETNRIVHDSWDALENLAFELMDRRRLSGEEAMRILKTKMLR